MKKLAVFIFFVFFHISAFANPEASASEAKTAYEAGNYDLALKLYDQLIADDYYAKELYFNAANAAVAKREYGKAILYLERAALRNRNNSMIKQNLDYLQQEALIDKIDRLPKSGIVAFWEALYLIFSSNTWAVLGLLSFCLAIAAFIIWQMGKNRTRRKQGFFAGITLVIFSALLLLFSWSNYLHMFKHNRGVVMKKETALNIAPDPDAQLVLNLHEGTTFTKIDELEGWIKIRLANGNEGWILLNSIQMI